MCIVIVCLGLSEAQAGSGGLSLKLRAGSGLLSQAQVRAAAAQDPVPERKLGQSVFTFCLGCNNVGNLTIGYVSRPHKKQAGRFYTLTLNSSLKAILLRHLDHFQTRWTIPLRTSQQMG